MNDRELAHEVLLLGLDDEVGLWEIVALVESNHPAGQNVAAIRDRALATVCHLAREGLVDAGRIEAGSFVRTAQLDALVQEVIDAYDGSMRGVWRYALWVSNTAAGDAVATAAGPLPEGYNPFDVGSSSESPGPGGTGV